MLDHILGRPSPGWKRFQVIMILIGVSTFLKKSSNKPTFKILESLNSICEKEPAWKIVVGTLSATYFINNLFLILGLNAPEPLSTMYTRNFYRATWVLTAMDAGFFTAMKIKPAFLRHICSFVFFFFYLVFADAADEKVRKFRAVATTEMMRLSWEKANSPIFKALTYFDRGFLNIRKDILIPRPKEPSPTSFPNTRLGPIRARFFFSGTEEQLRQVNKLIFHLHGGAFVAMNPRCHEDYISEWARITGLPIVSIDYGKAPEFPYPWALEESFDAYKSIVESNGHVLGMKGWYTSPNDSKIARSSSSVSAPSSPLNPTSKNKPLKIVVVGDSAGGNLAACLVMKCIESISAHITPPIGVVLIYPCLSFDMACWMPSQQMNLLRAESVKSMSKLMDAKYHLGKPSPLSMPEAPRGIDILNDKVDRSKSWYRFWIKKKDEKMSKTAIPSKLSMTSRMAYFSDRLLTPELMRAAALMYLGNSPVSYDFDTEYYLSPVVAPDELLARFPRTFLITGERDPLVDDTVVFAGRLRKAKEKARKEWIRKRRYREDSSTMTTIGRRQENTNYDDATNNTGDRRNGTSYEGAAGGLKFNGIQDDEESNSDYESSSTSRTGGYDEKYAHHIFSRDPDQMVRVKILEGISHAFFNFSALLPEARQATQLTAHWFWELFEDHDTDEKNIGRYVDDEISLSVGEELVPAAPHSGSYPIHGNIAHYHLQPTSPIETNDFASSTSNSSSPPQKPLPAAHSSQTQGKPSQLPLSNTLDSLKSSISESSLGSQRSRTASSLTMNEVEEKNMMERRRNQLASAHLN